MRDFTIAPYITTVLKPYADGGEPDAFERYLLDLDDADDLAIEARLVEVRTWWHNNRKTHAEFTDLIGRLLAEHNDLIGILESALQRQKAADDIRAARAARDADRYATVDQALEQLYATNDRRGIPTESIPRLVEIGVGAGLERAQVEQHIAAAMRGRGWSELDGRGAGAEPLEKGEAERIAAAVRQFGDTRRRQHADMGTAAPPDERPVLSLFDTLKGVAFDSDSGACAAGMADLDEELRTKTSAKSDFATAARRILELTKRHLADEQSIARYRATVVQEAAVALQDAFRLASVDATIDPGEYEQLVGLAAARGLPDDAARDVVVALVEGSPFTVRIEVAHNRVALISCAQCRAAAPGDGSQQACLRCGTALFRECGSCHKAAPRSESLCRHCGASLVAARQFDEDLLEGAAALDGAMPARAMQLGTSALQIDPASTEAQALVQRATLAVEAGRRQWQLVSQAEEEGRVYAARGAARTLVAEATDVESTSGERPREALSRLEAELSGVEQQLSEARALTDPAARERRFADVLARVRDCAEARRELERTPPSPPCGVTVELLPEGVHVAWSPSLSPGVTGYAVVRGTRQAPSSRGGGVVVSEVNETSMTDTTAPAGEPAFYAVFALRAGAESAAAGSPSLLVALEASDVAATVASEQVRLSWRLPAAGAVVEVERQGDGQRQRLVGGPDGIVDSAVRNGVPYRYLVRVRYGAELTPGVVVSATPAEPPRPVGHVTLEPAGSGVAIRWTPPAVGEVVICRSDAMVDLEPGTETSRDAVQALGHLLPGRDGTATDPTAADGRWYTPITLSGDRAVVGTGLRWTDLAAVVDVRVEDVGGDVRVTWGWPPAVHHAVVAWREGAAPAGPDDPAGHHEHVRRDTHQAVHGGAFRLTREAADQTLHVAVYGAQMRDGELIVGGRTAPSSRGSLEPSGARTTVRYEVKVRRGMRGKSLDVRLVGPDPHPEVILVAKLGDVIPLGVGDGQPVVRLGGDGAPSEVSVSVGALPAERPIALRAFLAADSARSLWLLSEPADLTSLVLR